MRYILLSLYLIYSFCHAQKSNPIVIDINEKLYTKVAYDTIENIISKQIKAKLEDKLNAAYSGALPINRFHVGNHYKIEELELISIPVFRISRFAFADYDCDKNFESYITFDERLKYQHTLIFKESKFLGSIKIPNEEYEMDKIYSGTDYIRGFEENYYASSLFFYENYKSEEFKIIQQRPDNFFFEIFGLNGYLFEIENGKIYCQYVGPCGCILLDGQTYEDAKIIEDNLKKRTPINEYIRKNEMVDRIKDVALGFYIYDWENPKLNKSKICVDNCPKGISIILNKASH